MKNCLFTYEPLINGEKIYSKNGLKKLQPKLKSLNLFPYSKEQQLLEAQRLAGKISIQGIQPKLSVRLDLSGQNFTVVDKGGTFIVKPQTTMYPELPENEDLTMHLAESAGIELPWHGLIKCEDGSLSYVIKRFDRKGRSAKIAQEDFAQLIGATRTTKYEATMERVAEVLSEFCTFPTLEGVKLFNRLIFSFLIGNEDMHLKNFSVLTDRAQKVILTPAYDLLNTTIAMVDPEEELALSLRDKKRGLKKADFEDFATSDLFLPKKKVEKEMAQMLSKVPEWLKKIDSSFLSNNMKKKYKDLLNQRVKRLW